MLLGVVAGLIVPRLGRGERRVAQRSVDAIRETLSAAAARASLSGTPVLIQHDVDRNVIEPLTRRPIADQGGTEFDAALGDWSSDPLLPLAVLEGVELVSLELDGVPTQARGFRVILGGTGNPGTNPSLALVLAQRSTRAVAASAPGSSLAPSGSSLSWRLELPSGHMRAFATNAQSTNDDPLRRVDLDAAGEESTPW
ncbi:MAG: hypothetical protein SFZ23_01915 [Planctomycetota bacterium]|nr:hypothetical protein [Planctomycetota bacterium]